MSKNRNMSRLMSALIVVVALLSWSHVATAANPARYAVVIGANEGDPDETKLRYAVEDARRMAQVLSTRGQFPGQQITTLEQPDEATVIQTLENVYTEIERRKRRSPDEHSLLVVYYSGHAGPDAMHLGGSRLAFDRVRELLEASPASVRVLIVDACRSGEITRVKGAAPTKPFEIELGEESSGEGTAVITSAAAGEQAQESDRLRGSFFTHHLLAALMGAADRSGDRQVTLAEAYQYAYDETLRSTSRAPYLQHPTYAFDIRGRRDVVMTHLDIDPDRFGQLRLPLQGHYVLFEDDANGRLVTELSSEGSTQISLHEGTYLTRVRRDDEVFEANFDVEAGQSLSLSEHMLSPADTYEVADKGRARAVPVRVALMADAGFSGEVVPETAPALLGRVGLLVDFDGLGLVWRLQYGRARFENPELRATQDIFGTRLGLLKFFGLDRLHLGVGLHGGADLFRQRFQTQRIAPDRSAVGLTAGGLAHIRYAATRTLHFFGSGEFNSNWVPMRTDGERTWAHNVSPQAQLGVLYYFGRGR